uniref:Uncharacterized protein n=1 Tax=Arundo donax TaxID=35708 RepID=A0A0A9HJ32_ARUDO
MTIYKLRFSSVILFFVMNCF